MALVVRQGAELPFGVKKSSLEGIKTILPTGRGIEYVTLSGTTQDKNWTKS